MFEVGSEKKVERRGGEWLLRRFISLAPQAKKNYR